MTPDELDALVAKMTEGPWGLDTHGVRNMNEIVVPLGVVGTVNRWEMGEAKPDQADADAAGIVALRNLAPLLLASWRLAEAHEAVLAPGPITKTMQFALKDALTAYRAAVAAREGK